MKMTGKPDVAAFLEGADTPKTEQIAKPTTVLQKPKLPQKSAERKPKMVALPASMLIDLKRRSIDESERAGVRVTETEIIERALETYLYR